MGFCSEHSAEEICFAGAAVGGAVLGAVALFNSGRANLRVTRLTGRVEDLESTVENIKDGDAATDLRIAALQQKVDLLAMAD